MNDDQFIRRFEDFCQRTEKDFDEVKERLQELWDTRSRAHGGFIVISGLVSLLVTCLVLYFEKH